MTSPTSNVPSHRKFALIIGNGKYQRSNIQLNHLIKNAKDIHDQLENLKFKVTMKLNIIADIAAIIQDFVKTIQHADLVLVYYVGLSCHVQDRNFLVPVGDNQTEADINFEDNANDVQRILNRLVPENAPYATILILDCCRPYVLKSTATPDCKCDC